MASIEYDLLSMCFMQHLIRCCIWRYLWKILQFERLSKVKCCFMWLSGFMWISGFMWLSGCMWLSGFMWISGFMWLSGCMWISGCKWLSGFMWLKVDTSGQKW